jgi:hypothetical protein
MRREEGRKEGREGGVCERETRGGRDEDPKKDA